MFVLDFVAFFWFFFGFAFFCFLSAVMATGSILVPVLLLLYSATEGFQFPHIPYN